MYKHRIFVIRLYKLPPFEYFKHVLANNKYNSTRHVYYSDDGIVYERRIEK